MWRIERATGSGVWIGYVPLFVPIAVYAVIGLPVAHVRSRRILRGRAARAVCLQRMATAADWLSAASFIGLAGSLYATGYDALAYVMGWTGGFCLVAFLLAPYVRKLARYTIPDFLGTRFEYGRARWRPVRRSCVRSCTLSRRSRDRPDRDALHRRRFRDRDFLQASRAFSCVRSRRDARGHVDAGRAVHHPDQRDPDSGFADRDEERASAPCRSSITAS